MSRAGLRLAVLAAAPVLVLAAVPLADAPARAVSASGASTSGAATAGADVVDGTIERVSIESGAILGREGAASIAGRESAMTTWVQTRTGHVQVPTSALSALPVGTRVRLLLAAVTRVAAGARASAVAEAGRPVLASEVLAPAAPLVTAPASAQAATSPLVAASPHIVTVVLGLPTGATRDATTASQLSRVITGPVNTFWSLQTGGRVRFTVGKALGWTPLAHGCADPWGMWSDATARSGFVPGARRHLVLYVPASAVGCYPGLGMVGSGIDSGGMLYVQGTLPGLPAHELGHNLGLGHSNGLQCNAVADGSWTGTAWAGGCQRQAYRDWYDVMGVSWDYLGTLSTSQAYLLGVLGAPASQTITEPTSVTLQAVSGHVGLQSLRVVDPAGPIYTIEYRPASGADSWLSANWRALVPGVLVRRADPTDPQQTLLLDGSPSATGGFGADWDAPLATGETLTTGSGRVAIRVDDVDGSSATVSVAIDGEWPASSLARLGQRVPDDGRFVVTRHPSVHAAGGSPSSPVRRTPVPLPSR